ncbi:MAG TPA: hydrogenase maturation protease [Caldithrix abyssi]|uniref:Hydrogenase maturation protease n=1 Tax=Caldithrix abyssi TaxID=187145 RepID=A0A7V1PUQ7_CALAY|nr:hydrogenase maturation protease [Caldithrix abyssi]
MGDEGVGVHAVRALQKKKLPPHVSCLDGGTGGMVLLGPMQEAQKIIIIDATMDGGPPGRVCRLVPKFSGDYPVALTAHDIGLKDVLDAFYLMGRVPEVILFAVSILPLSGGLSLDLSPEINKNLPQLIKTILMEIQ